MSPAFVVALNCHAGTSMPKPGGVHLITRPWHSLPPVGFSHFFAAGFGSIYPALAELSRRGLVTSRSVEQEGRPDKKIYSITPEGERVLAAELAATPPRHKVRSQFLALMYFAHLLPPERVAGIIDQMIAQWEPTVAKIESCLSAEQLTPGMRFAAGYGHAVLGAALAYVRANKADLVREVATATDRETLALAGE
jgi:PadR family transcriptional regulator, regulatory protein AphA